MRKIVFALAIAGGIVMAGCAATKDFFRNVTAADCATPQSQQAFVNNLPGIALIPPAQMDQAVAQVCVGLYGTVAAPTPAAGNAPVFPAATPSVVASPAASPVAAK